VRRLTLLCALVLAGCGSSTRTPPTDLRILAINANVGRAAFHLTCGPAGGDVASPEHACTALAGDPTLVTHPRPFVCAGGFFSWWEITITGRLHGRPLHLQTSTCWTPQMAMIGRLGLGTPQKHLLPRRTKAVIPGTQRLFPIGLMRPADLVTCDILGHHLEDGVPEDPGTSEAGYGGKNVVSVSLRVTLNRDGSVTASCAKHA
jgi:hypothetical protein